MLVTHTKLASSVTPHTLRRASSHCDFCLLTQDSILLTQIPPHTVVVSHTIHRSLLTPFVHFGVPYYSQTYQHSWITPTDFQTHADNVVFGDPNKRDIVYLMHINSSASIPSTLRYTSMFRRRHLQTHVNLGKANTIFEAPRQRCSHPSVSDTVIDNQ
jgi:hypothetical protein